MALGFQAMCADLGDDIRIRLYTDSAAAMGMIGRRGLGKVRHIEVGYLWLQDLVADKRISMSKVKGTENPADLDIKHLSAEDIEKCVSLINCFYADGRSLAVPSIAK